MSLNLGPLLDGPHCSYRFTPPRLAPNFHYNEPHEILQDPVAAMSTLSIQESVSALGQALVCNVAR